MEPAENYVLSTVHAGDAISISFSTWQPCHPQAALAKPGGGGRIATEMMGRPELELFASSGSGSGGGVLGKLTGRPHGGDAMSCKAGSIFIVEG
uniref:Uncharacterized protein n=1 Tax=Oryza brachyantha TaxID=4533 RepID=J3LRA5_ORYBR